MILTLVLCLMTGITVGLLGAGGSVLTVPIFVYSAGMSAQEAISLSLFVVSLTSLAGSLRYIVRRWVNFRLAVIFIFFGSIAAFGGAQLSSLVSGKTLLILFGTLMLVTGLILYLKDSPENCQDDFQCRPRFIPAMLISIALGILTGFLGVGGGFLIVPVLALIMKCSMKSAIGTSLIIISVNALAGFAGHALTHPFDWRNAALYSAGTLSGALLGSLFAVRIPGVLLRKIFAVLIIGTGIFVIAKNIRAF